MTRHAGRHYPLSYVAPEQSKISGTNVFWATMELIHHGLTKGILPLFWPILVGVQPNNDTSFETKRVFTYAGKNLKKESE